MASRLVSLTFVWFTVNGQRSRNLLASGNPFCVNQNGEETSLFNNTASTLKRFISQTSVDKTDYVNTLQALCDFADASSTECLSAATALTSNNTFDDILYNQLAQLSDTEQKCKIAWQHYIANPSHKAGTSDVSKMKNNLLSALRSNDINAAVRYLSITNSDAAVEAMHYGILAHIDGADVNDIVGLTFPDAVPYLKALTPLFSDWEQRKTNWYAHAEPLYDLLRRFVQPPHYEFAIGKDGEFTGEMSRDLVYHLFDIA
eukprot:182087_1